MITSRNWSEIAQYGNLENWREILASLVTYATNEDFANLCGKFMYTEGKLVYVQYNYAYVAYAFITFSFRLYDQNTKAQQISSKTMF